MVNVASTISAFTFKEFDVFDRPYNYNIGSLYCKKDILSEKELKLLCILLKDAILNYEEHDDFKASLFNLMESYIEELDKRKEISEKKLFRQTDLLNLKNIQNLLQNVLQDSIPLNLLN